MHQKVGKDEVLAAFIMEREFGDIIYHQEISRTIEERYGTQKYTTIVTAAKKRLMDSGYMVKNIRKTGYQIVEPDDYPERAVNEIRAGARRISKGSKIMRHAPVAHMSVNGRITYNRVNDRIQILEAAVSGAKVEVHMLSKKSHPLAIDKDGNGDD